MYIETSAPRKQGDKARLMSRVFGPVIPPKKCVMTMYYHMYGSNIGALNVYTRTGVNAALNQIWSRTRE